MKSNIHNPGLVLGGLDQRHARFGLAVLGAGAPGAGGGHSG